MYAVGKWLLYVFLFVLTAGAMFVIFGVTIFVTRFFLWWFVPSGLVYGTVLFVSFAVFATLLVVAWRKHRGGLMAASLGGVLVPTFLLTLVLLDPVLPDEPVTQLANQRQPSPSPSGRYILHVPIERSKTHKGPYGFGLPYWYVTVSDPNGNIIYRDPDESFHGVHNVYWVWDDEDRIWLFNSDDGGVYLYEFIDGNWRKAHWGYGRTRETNRGISPPRSLYPSYVMNNPMFSEIVEALPKQPKTGD